jgi:hypothetical protein
MIIDRTSYLTTYFLWLQEFQVGSLIEDGYSLIRIQKKFFTDPLQQWFVNFLWQTQSLVCLSLSYAQEAEYRGQCCGSGAVLTPGSGIGKKSGSGSGMINPDHISESLEIIFWGWNTSILYADPGSAMEKFWSGIRVWKKFGFGIRDKHPGSATLIEVTQSNYVQCDDGLHCGRGGRQREGRAADCSTGAAS